MKQAVGCMLAFLLLFPLLFASLAGSSNAADQAQQASQQSVGAAGPLNTAKVPQEYVALLQQAASTCAEYPAPLQAAQIEAESGWNPNAVSPVGAQGLAQFMPGTWAGLGVPGSPLDPAAAIPAMAKYMCALIASVKGDMASGKITRGTLIQNALAAYNCGLGNVWASRGFPTGIAETDAYVPRILSLQANYTSAPVVLGGATGPADVSANGPCPLGNSDTGVSCNRAITYAAAQIGVYGWNNRCLNLVTLAYGGQFAGIGNLWAITAARAVQAAGLMQPPTTNFAAIPRGAVIWYEGEPGRPGHVVISVGGGQAISTDAPNKNTVGVVPISYFSTSWGMPMVGWSPPRV